MDRAISATRKEKRTMSEKQARVASFIGGLVFFSAVAVVILMKNDKLRAEVEEQAAGLLKTTKSAVSQIKFVVSKIGNTAEKRNAAVNQEKSAKNKENILNNEYDEQWASLI